jgi:hypothetical protein
MRTQSRDTSPEIERIQIAGIRALSPARKFALVRSITSSMMYANTHSNGDVLNDEQRALDFVGRQYGSAWVDRLAADFKRQPAWMLRPFDADPHSTSCKRPVHSNNVQGRRLSPEDDNLCSTTAATSEGRYPGPWHARFASPRPKI